MPDAQICSNLRCYPNINNSQIKPKQTLQPPEKKTPKNKKNRLSITLINWTYKNVKHFFIDTEAPAINQKLRKWSPGKSSSTPAGHQNRKNKLIP